MRIRPLHDTLGAELLDFDITKAYGPEDQAELRRLFCEHHLLLVRGQAPTEADQDRFAQSFGPLTLSHAGGNAGYVSNKGNPDKHYQTGTDRLLWHGDGAYGAYPGIGTSLWAKEVTPNSTPTLFLNNVHALKTLPARLRERIKTLTAVHMRDTAIPDTSRPFRESALPDSAEKGRILSHEKPIIYRPPHNDVDTLYVNDLMTSHINGLPRDEADALLKELFEHLYADHNIYTHRWQINDVIIWDNIILQHARPAAMGTERRHLRRLSLDGWNTGSGVLDWFAGGSPRHLAWLEEQKRATA
jgi:taurine dioxygenase